jgi:hypothetical protein
MGSRATLPVHRAREEALGTGGASAGKAAAGLVIAPFIPWYVI